VLAEHGVSSNPANFELYREVVLEVLAANMQQRQQAAEEHARWVKLSSLALQSETLVSACFSVSERKLHVGCVMSSKRIGVALRC
jgi:hypothetical protein